MGTQLSPQATAAQGEATSPAATSPLAENIIRAALLAGAGGIGGNLLGRFSGSSDEDPEAKKNRLRRWSLAGALLGGGVGTAVPAARYLMGGQLSGPDQVAAAGGLTAEETKRLAEASAVAQSTEKAVAKAPTTLKGLGETLANIWKNYPGTTATAAGSAASVPVLSGVARNLPVFREALARRLWSPSAKEIGSSILDRIAGGTSSLDPDVVKSLRNRVFDPAALQKAIQREVFHEIKKEVAAGNPGASLAARRQTILDRAEAVRKQLVGRIPSTQEELLGQLARLSGVKNPHSPLTDAENLASAKRIALGGGLFRSGARLRNNEVEGYLRGLASQVSPPSVGIKPGPKQRFPSPQELNLDYQNARRKALFGADAPSFQDHPSTWSLLKRPALTNKALTYAVPAMAIGSAWLPSAQSTAKSNLGVALDQLRQQQQSLQPSP